MSQMNLMFYQLVCMIWKVNVCSIVTLVFRDYFFQHRQFVCVWLCSSFVRVWLNTLFYAVWSWCFFFWSVFIRICLVIVRSFVVVLMCCRFFLIYVWLPMSISIVCFSIPRFYVHRYLRFCRCYCFTWFRF